MDKNTQEFSINNACNYYCKQYTNACARVTVGGPFSSKIDCIHSRNLGDMLSMIYLVNRILFITNSIFTFGQYFSRFPCKKIPIFALSGKENGCFKKLKFNIFENRAQKLAFMHIHEPSLLQNLSAIHPSLYRGFSRDVIAAKSAKSRCSQRPCWISQNMA